MTPVKTLIIGKSGRLDAILDAVCRSSRASENYVLSEVNNPGLQKKAVVEIGQTDDLVKVRQCAEEIRPDFAIIGPEEPLAAGVVEANQRSSMPPRCAP